MRADIYLTSNGYAVSRQQAKRLIEDGGVTVDGKTVRKASEEISECEHAVVIQNTLAYVGRGGLKLEAALDAFGFNVNGKTALDIGASTGGFTDCLLQRGAKQVCAVDSGTGQLAASLRTDHRVRCMENCNARYLTAKEIGGCVDLIVMDVSFISATLILPRFPDLLESDGSAICLIKPQFEVGRAMIGKGGIVKDRKAHRMAIDRVLETGRAVGLRPVGLIPSPIVGGDGNREFLVWFVRGSSDAREVNDGDIRRVTDGKENR
ncbi:MAG: TlyA family RNA methyltransferase [Clostridia bacterium]|nr:TlyA family RNA methyltransferase [Clostridia bacterium]